jgi:hypothetical protein
MEAVIINEMKALILRQDNLVTSKTICDNSENKFEYKEVKFYCRKLKK